MATDPDVAATLGVLRTALEHLTELLTDEPTPEPQPQLGLRVADTTANTVAVEWTGEALGWTIARDGVDMLGSGPWSTTLAADVRRFRFTALRPATEYTLTLTPAGGVGVAVKATTAGSVPQPPPPISGEHGPVALASGWATREVARDDFNGQIVDTTRWSLYNSAGHGGRGVRRPSQFSVVDDPTALGGRTLRVVGTADGATGGMAHKLGQRFGRWAARMRIPDGDPRWHPVLLTWSDAENWPLGGEIDYAEGKCGVDRMEFFLHYSAQNQQTHGALDVDVSQWHWYEMEWTTSHVRGWCDGRLYFEDTNTGHFNYPGFNRHHGTIQLDWFPGSATRTGGGEMLVDAYRVYSHPDSR
jgi:hypothetical protein